MTSFGTDAQKWAEEFIRFARTSLIQLDEATMTSWFANAIMAGHDEAQRKYEMVNKHEHTMGMLGINVKPEGSQPEPININELKRLLVEVVADIMNREARVMSYEESMKDKIRIFRQIENAILNGDDS